MVFVELLSNIYEKNNHDNVKETILFVKRIFTFKEFLPKDIWTSSFSTDLFTLMLFSNPFTYLFWILLHLTYGFPLFIFCSISFNIVLLSEKIINLFQYIA